MSVLFSAIADPDKNGKKALDMLLSTTFVNTVDAASLALIIPVVQKSLRDRSGEAKKRASRIVGSMCALINDPKVIFSKSRCCCSNLLFSSPCCSCFGVCSALADAYVKFYFASCMAMMKILCLKQRLYLVLRAPLV